MKGKAVPVTEMVAEAVPGTERGALVREKAVAVIEETAEEVLGTGKGVLGKEKAAEAGPETGKGVLEKAVAVTEKVAEAVPAMVAEAVPAKVEEAVPAAKVAEKEKEVTVIKKAEFHQAGKGEGTVTEKVAEAAPGTERWEEKAVPVT